MTKEQRASVWLVLPIIGLLVTAGLAYGDDRGGFYWALIGAVVLAAVAVFGWVRGARRGSGRTI